ncbi:2'-5' RNA ligase family protein [Frankia sp. CNm7]|uniref:2'-5' RNA ligase family protein n=1 Tax=Frankia nepalensis TaxID=1836974 RepID=A0A937USL6_9ACTN|nr:2'-5' RNA ligase family protein [Frankia nepalensis]MBL7499879.1 2'-5' RNA ligase family protein [Frankia nepalensis]MBL7512303.1 2'-5' RNA ligase family protein [Frankia nepalensis]MBL7516974.1 2'-5' RNA ligase family protein [Frankia nepalensis]MBL7629011.1 2'-5' RNA ligase family protein [Frankia nepalensis]
MSTTTSSVDPVADDWDRFAALDRLADHWDRPGWTPGRRSYHWMLTFENATDVHALAARCQERLRLPVLDLVPADGLHLTLQRLAFTDQVAPVEVDAAVEEARRRLGSCPAFTLTVGPLAGSSGAVRFSVQPWEPVVAVRAVVLDATAAALGPDRVAAKPQGFRPHIGIAYSNSIADAQPIVAEVVRLRRLATVTVHVGAVALVELRREGRSYRWDTITRLSLPFHSPAG